MTEQHQLSAEQKVQVLALWNHEYPQSLNHASIASFEAYLDALSDQCHYLINSSQNELMAYAFTFTREAETWFAIIVNPGYQNQKTGTMLLNALKATHTKLNGWVIDHENSKKSNGTSYKTPLAFYLKNNFSIIPHIRLENEMISAVKILWEA